MENLVMKALLTKFFSLLILSLSYNTSALAQNFTLLIPDFAVTQVAGSIGYLSVGAGYDLFKNQRGSLEFTYGHVPESKGGPLNIVSTKFAYRPFQIKLNSKAKIYPLNPGAFLSYHLDKQFDFAFDKEQYGKSYYGWSTALRGHLSLGNEIKFYTSGNKIKTVALYSEFNVSDLYLASIFYTNNKEWLKPKDIIKLGIGVKVGF
jgi:hypothetical protein